MQTTRDRFDTCLAHRKAFEESMEATRRLITARSSEAFPGEFSIARLHALLYPTLREGDLTRDDTWLDDLQRGLTELGPLCHAMECFPGAKLCPEARR